MKNHSEKRLCSLEGCDDVHEAKGLCKSHYQQMRRGTKPGAPMQLRRPEVLGEHSRYVPLRKRRALGIPITDFDE